MINKSFFLIFIVIGICSIIGSVFVAVELLNFLDSSVKTQATIVDVVQVPSVNHGYTQFPVFRFFDLYGEEVFARGNSDFSEYTIGQQMEIYYDPQNPTGIVHQNNMSMWGPTVLLLAVGLIFVGIGSVFFLKGYYVLNQNY